jgi:peptide chain release factor 1
MCESGGGGRIGKIISWHIDGLYRGNGTSLGGGNSLLESTKIGGESGLVTYSGWDTTEKSGHFRASLGESEDVVDEQEHILVLFISEILSNSETSQTDTGSGTWGLIHLTVHKSGLRLVRVQMNNTRLDHFVEEIVTFTGTLTDTGEDGVTTVSLCDVVNQLHNEHSLTDTGTSKETNFTTSGVRGQEIDDLDTYL